MWEEYTNNHQGVCLAVNEQFIHDSHFRRETNILKVMYSDTNFKRALESIIRGVGKFVKKH